jgi:hypothetical protein
VTKALDDLSRRAISSAVSAETAWAVVVRKIAQMYKTINTLIPDV